MPWCPKCRSEYREGFTECADCKAALVEELPPVEEKKLGFVCRTAARGTDPFADGRFTAEDQPVLLLGLEDEDETLRLCELLDSCHVPAFPIRREGERMLEEERTEEGEFPAYVEIAAEDLPDLPEDESDDWYDQMMAEAESPYEIYVPTFAFERALSLIEEDEAAQNEKVGEETDGSETAEA
ncbi:MAG: hypothetical protein HFE86_08345 [Clostridiales bacterium]|nr:hypothetical protein [Clostridiales bacterium]